MFHRSAKSLALVVTAFAVAAVIHTVTAEQNNAGQNNGGDADAGGARKSVHLLSLDFSRDASLVVTGGDAVRVYATQTGKLVHRLDPPRTTRVVAFSPTTNDLFAAAGDDGSIRLIRVGNGKPVRVLKGDSGMVVNVAFSPNGKLLASCATRYPEGKPSLGELKVWNIGTGETVGSVKLTRSGVYCVAFSKSGDLLAFSQRSRDKNVSSTVEVYNVDKWQRVRSIPFGLGFALSISFVPDGRKLILTGGHCIRLSANSCLPTGKLWFANLNSDDPATQLTTKQYGYFRSASLTPRGRRFATGATAAREYLNSSGQIVRRSLVTQIQMRRTDSGDLLWSQDGEIGDPYGVTISPDGKLVGCCSGSKILMFDTESGAPLRQIIVTR